MPLYCPFCHAPESERVSAMEGGGKEIILLMFDCPFFFKINPEELASEARAQEFLNQWREKDGDKWLEGIGPILRDREMKNIQRSNVSLSPL